MIGYLTCSHTRRPPRPGGAFVGKLPGNGILGKGPEEDGGAVRVGAPVMEIRESNRAFSFSPPFSLQLALSVGVATKYSVSLS